MKKMRQITLTFSLVVAVFTTASVLAEFAQTPVTPDPIDFAPDRIIIRFEPMPENLAAQQRQALPSVRQLRRLLPTSRRRSADPAEDGPHQIYIAELIPGTDVVFLAQQISAMPEVRYAEPDHIVCIDDTFPDDPDFIKLWGLRKHGPNWRWV